MNMLSGIIILLNGPSSSGKSTLAKELQTCIKESRNEEYGIVSIDDFLVMDVHRNIYEEDVFDVSSQIGEKLKEILKNQKGAIVDHVITSERIFHQFMKDVSGCSVILIHVTCPVQELMKRERERRNRCIGSAEASFEYLYPKDGYDLTIDTFELSAKECVGEIISLL